MRHAPLKLVIYGIYGAVPVVEILARDHKEVLWPKDSVKLFTASVKR